MVQNPLPYGALLGLLSVLSPFKVKRNASHCIDCRRCTEVCPNDILVHTKTRIDSPECFGCFDCVANRHSDKCLNTTNRFNHKLIPYIIAILMTATVVGGAMSAGYWKSSVTNQEYRRYLMIMDKLSH